MKMFRAVLVWGAGHGSRVSNCESVPKPCVLPWTASGARDSKACSSLATTPWRTCVQRAARGRVCVLGKVGGWDSEQAAMTRGGEVESHGPGVAPPSAPG
jgi:hypothetical protein